MIKEKVVQKSTYICDKCKNQKVVETELESCYRKYEEIESDVPEGFYEIEEFDCVLCSTCYEALRMWIGR